MLRRLCQPWWSLLGVLLGCAALGSCGGPGYFTLEGATMGTYYRITALCPGSGAEAMAQRVETTLGRVNGQMSTYLPESELSRLNQAAVGVWLPASDPLREVIGAALEINGMSAGAFDVTVGPLVNLWGFGPDGNITRAPSQAAIDDALQRTGSRYLEVDEKQRALLKQRALYIDLSAIAKGYGVDQVAETLMLAGCRDQLVDIGGEVAARGRNPGGRFWQIGIEVPDPERFGAVERIVPLADMAVATSGDYRNFLDLDNGQRVSHTIDPRAGTPVRHDLASVTVLHDSAMWADGLATALNVLGPDEGMAMAEREGLAAVFLVRRADGFEARYTADLQNYLDTHQ